MGEKPSDLNPRIDKSRRDSFVRVLIARKFRFLAAAVAGAALLVGVPWVIAYSGSPLEPVATTQGEFIGAFSRPRRVSYITSRSRLSVSVRLVDGATISVTLRDPSIYEPNRAVDIGVYRRVWWPHGLVYRFEGYADGAPRATTPQN